MRPEQYDAWHATQKGAWIGEEEYHPITSLPAIRQDETLPDVGCGISITITSSKHWNRHLEPLLRHWLPGCGGFIAFAADALPDHHH